MTLFAFKISYICYNFLEIVSAVNNVDTREKIADLEAKIVDLEKQNVGLKNKVQFITCTLFCPLNMCFVIYSIIFFVISVKSTSIKFKLTVIYDHFQWLLF